MKLRQIENWQKILSKKPVIERYDEQKPPKIIMTNTQIAKSCSEAI